MAAAERLHGQLHGVAAAVASAPKSCARLRSSGFDRIYASTTSLSCLAMRALTTCRAGISTLAGNGKYKRDPCGHVKRDPPR